MFKSSVPLLWRLRKSRYNLIGTKCLNCGNVYFPPKTFCPNCRRNSKIEEFVFSGNGEIVSYTIIKVPPEGFERQVPYVVGIIKLDEGVNVSGQIIGDLNKIEIGKRVKAVFRKMFEDGPDGLIHYGLKFELID